ncbi:MAG: hypothetical protein CVU57_00785 [Deltaproteobacteria bacterium HGW-Deltaproteobacteria-15]|nr:MAG: hypothetical protein CVU57_00785 [Deltaproteobacteria bacterium HGW-Deltaproteobacteria-15]
MVSDTFLSDKHVLVRYTLTSWNILTKEQCPEIAHVSPLLHFESQECFPLKWTPRWILIERFTWNLGPLHSKCDQIRAWLPASS